MFMLTGPTLHVTLGILLLGPRERLAAAYRARLNSHARLVPGYRAA